MPHDIASKPNQVRFSISVKKIEKGLYEVKDLVSNKRIWRIRARSSYGWIILLNSEEGWKEIASKRTKKKCLQTLKNAATSGEEPL